MEDHERNPHIGLCRLLRWKNLFIDAGSTPGNEPCWCVETQKPLGPDGQVVTPEACTPDRACYERD